jgi:large repetitive protein
MVVRREAFPNSLSTSINPSSTNWPSGGSWAATTDWSQRQFPTVGGTNENGRILAMGMGRPLEPGRYYIGIINQSQYSEPMNYTLVSRWIGHGLAISPQTIAWTNATVTNTVAPREADYYEVIIPPNTRSWKVRLTTVTGEAMLVAVTNRVPNVLSEKRVTKLGKEHFVLLPPPNNEFLAAGTNYIAVVGEGQNPPDNTRIGTNNSTYILETLGTMPEIELGTLGADLITTGALEGGESIAYHFNTIPGTLGFWITLEDRVGNPVAVSRGEDDLADPGLAGGGPTDPYGNDGGEISGAVQSPFRITVSDPFPRETIMVKARQQSSAYPDASYTLRVEEIIPNPVAFNGGVTNVANQDPLRGGYYVIDVPTNALGWDIRLTNVTAGSPQMVVARDFIPIFLNNFNMLPNVQTNWPSFSRWVATRDWTERSTSAGGTNEDGRILAMGMGRPLEPGRYYVAVLGTTATPISYTLVSRGIGSGFSIPVTDLAFTGGSVTVTGLPPREAAYFRVQVPTNAASWRVVLNTNNGESMLVASKDTLPNVLVTANNNLTNTAGRKMQKLGDEYFLDLPSPSNGFVAGGTYYLAVVGEGVNPVAGRVGLGTSDFTLTSVGAATVRNLGQIGFADLVETNVLAGGDVQLYQFTVPASTLSMEARLDDRIGNPVMVLRQGSRIPDPGVAGGSISVENYGHDNGENLGNDVHASFLNIPNPSNSVYTLAVMARGNGSGVYSNTSYTLRLNASGSTTLSADGGLWSVTNQNAGSWRYFRVTIPTNAMGWDVRLINVATGGLPRLVIRRESLPSVLSTTPWSSPGSLLAWPTNNQWAPGQDWTKRSFSPDNTVNEDGRVFTAGMGRPLEPGTYYIGVINQSGQGGAMSYTLWSRLIGPGYSIPVIDVPYVGAATNLSLPPREAAFFRVIVPSNAPSWKVKLNGISGESLLVALRGGIPNIELNTVSGTLANGKGMQKLGNDHFVLLPSTGLTNLPSSTNYFAVVSEGVNPASPTRIGSGASSFIFESQGALTTNDLGLLTSEDILYPDALEGGEVRTYQFLVPPGMLGLKVRLENRVGNPAAVFRQGDRWPDPGASVIGVGSDSYGNEGGYSVSDGGASLFTVANPLPGVQTLTVKARQSGANYPDASYTIRLQEVLVPEVNFSSDLNTNGLQNSVSGVLEDNERVFFKIVIPPTNAGQPVIGWKLDLVQSSGLASMRVRKDSLPSDTAINQLSFVTASAIIVPPFLTNGVWYVEVKGAGSTAFTLTSSPLLLERPVWSMPAPNSTNQTPGLTPPTFGDTAVDVAGVPFPDPSIFLQVGASHYYALDVPSTNNGLLRVVLEAVSGNPDLYLRYGGAPTLYHTISGSPGNTFDRSMTLASGTEYANWVPFDGKVENKLKPGLWYIAVRAAGNANARYRMRLSTGNVLDIPVHGSDVTNQLVAGGDWRYYRVQMPTSLPGGFNVTFSQQSGDVIVYLRDTLPPGNGTSDFRDWLQDAKNHGPYLNFDPAGTYSFSVPPVRPGHVYYIGVRAVSDAAFTIRCTTNGAPNVEPPTIAFYGGLATTNLPPFGQAIYRIDVPADATRWKHAATHAGGVQLHLEQGTLPLKSSFDDWRSLGTTNSTLNQYLSGTWPWVSNQSYFLMVTNTTAQSQDFVFAMDGRSIVTDDNDNDGLPDAWEFQYFGNTGTQSGSGDPDADGVTNIEEYNEGTNPNDRTSFRPRLFTAALNGAIVRNPNAASYALNSLVDLTPVPASGYAFVAWTGNASGRAVPLTLTMDGHKTVGALFKLAGDEFVTALPLSGTSATAIATNVSMTKEAGEPNHAGNPGGKSIWFRWTAPSSGPVRITTAGSAFNTLLGVYTGPTVSSLTVIASDANSGGTSNRSTVNFNAVAGTTYQIAVDGVNGASSRVNLSLTLGTGLRAQLRSVTQLIDGRAQFLVAGAANRTYTVEATEDFVTWSDIGSVITDGAGNGSFIDTAAVGFTNRYYRLRE